MATPAPDGEAPLAEELLAALKEATGGDAWDSVGVVRRAEEADGTFHVVAVHPRGGRPAEMWIDAAIPRLARLVEGGRMR